MDSLSDLYHCGWGYVHAQVCSATFISRRLRSNTRGLLFSSPDLYSKDSRLLQGKVLSWLDFLLLLSSNLFVLAFALSICGESSQTQCAREQESLAKATVPQIVTRRRDVQLTTQRLIPRRRGPRGLSGNTGFSFP